MNVYNNKKGEKTKQKRETQGNCYQYLRVKFKLAPARKILISSLLEVANGIVLFSEFYFSLSLIFFAESLFLADWYTPC